MLFWFWLLLTTFKETSTGHISPTFPRSGTSVATKIENGPKTKTKNLRIWKIDRRRRRRFFGILNNLRRPSKIGISSKIFEEPKIFRRIEREMHNLKSMYCEKNSDEIDHYKNFGHQKVFSIFIQKNRPIFFHFPSKFLQQKMIFFWKNLRNLRPKIFEASKILRHLKMNRRWRRRWIFGQKSSKLRRSSKLHCNTAPYRKSALRPSKWPPNTPKFRDSSYFYMNYLISRIFFCFFTVISVV